MSLLLEGPTRRQDLGSTPVTFRHLPNTLIPHPDRDRREGGTLWRDLESKEYHYDLEEWSLLTLLPVTSTPETSTKLS